MPNYDYRMATGQVRCKTGWMDNRKNGGQDKCRINHIQDRTDAVQDGTLVQDIIDAGPGQNLDRTDSVQGGCKTGCKQGRTCSKCSSDAVENRCRTGWM